MKKNIGTTDKIIRAVIGTGFVAAAVFTETWWLVIPGIMAFGTVLFGFCGLYTLLGVSTCPVEEAKKQK